MKLKGGSLKVKEIKAFLEASYEEDAPKEIMGYELDEKLSFLYGKVRRKGCCCTSRHS